MHTYAPQIPHTAYPYQQAYPVQRIGTPASATLTLVLTIVVFGLALLASPLTILFSIGAIGVAADASYGYTASDAPLVALLGFAPLGLPALLGAALAFFPRIRMPRELFPDSGTKTAATVFLVLHLLTLALALVFAALPVIALA